MSNPATQAKLALTMLVCLFISGSILPLRAQEPDIPLTPKNGGRSIAISALKTGDVIVSTTKSFLSEAIRKQSGSAVSHALLYVGDGYVVEAIGEGVSIRKLDEALADATLAVAFRHRSISTHVATGIREFAMGQLGKPYNLWGVVFHPRFGIVPDNCAGLNGQELSKCSNRKGLVAIVTGGENKFYCSQLVLAAYTSAGLTLFDASLGGSSPSDIPQLNIIGDLLYVGHLRSS